MSRRLRLPTVALVGRTNVGKSTLFNRLLEQEQAITSPEAGTTRDLGYGFALWRGQAIQIVDTGGLDIAGAGELERNVVRQASRATSEADCILFVLDVATGPLPQDKELARELSKSKVPVILVGNKADNPRARAQAANQSWAALRLGELQLVSAKNGTGTGDLLDLVLEKLGGRELGAPTEAETKIAIIGRPNVGKSSLLNRLVGEERMIVAAAPGTTRQPEDTLIVSGGERYLLIDTVGIRTRRREERPVELAGLERTLRAVERAEVLLLVIEGAEEITAGDRALAGQVKDSGKAVVLVVNKWDLVRDKSPSRTTREAARLKALLPFFTYAPVRFASAKTGQGVLALLEAARVVKESWQKRITERELDRFFRRALSRALAKGPKRPFIYSLKQTGDSPPTFLLSIRGKEPPPAAFLRYLEKMLRQRFGFEGTPIRVRAKNVQVRP